MHEIARINRARSGYIILWLLDVPFSILLQFFSCAVVSGVMTPELESRRRPPALSRPDQGKREDMNTKSIIKLVKKGKRESPPVRSEAELVNDNDENRWSRAVRSWVNDFQQNANKETLPAFDRLFKDAA